MRERKRTYELMVIISPLAASDEEVNGIVQRLRQVIETSNGELLRVDTNSPWGRRRLAYPIQAFVPGEASRRTFHEGLYALIYFTIPSIKVGDIERTIKLTDPILRHLLTLVEERDVANLTKVPAVPEVVATPAPAVATEAAAAAPAEATPAAVAPAAEAATPAAEAVATPVEAAAPASEPVAQAPAAEAAPATTDAVEPATTNA